MANISTTAELLAFLDKAATSYSRAKFNLQQTQKEVNKAQTALSHLWPAFTYLSRRGLQREVNNTTRGLLQDRFHLERLAERYNQAFAEFNLQFVLYSGALLQAKHNPHKTLLDCFPEPKLSPEVIDKTLQEVGEELQLASEEYNSIVQRTKTLLDLRLPLGA